MVVDANGNILHGKFTKYEARMNRQIKHKFQEIQAKRTVVNKVHGLRLNCQTLDEFGEEAYNVETINIKQTSRYHMEDCTKMHHGDAIMLYFQCDACLIIRNVKAPSILLIYVTLPENKLKHKSTIHQLNYVSTWYPVE